MVDENPEVKKITKTELLDSLKGIVANQLKELDIEGLVNKAVEPLKVQVTENMAKVATATTKEMY